MPVLGILTCEILELEFAYLLKSENDIARITVLENSHSFRLLDELGSGKSRLESPDELLSDTGVPIFIPMDEDHPVDDCVGLVIGGRRSYYEEQCKVAGTFFMIPGWTCHWQSIFDKNFGNLSVDMARRMFKDYERSLLIPTPIMSEETMKQNAAEFNALFELQEETCPGTLEILMDSWKSAKEFLGASDS